MNLQEKINNSLKEAMRAKDKIRLESIRAIKSELLIAKTSGTNQDINTDDELKILQKLVKQRKDSAAIFTQQGRTDLAENELAQAKIIEEFLPKQLSDLELETELKKIIAQTGASSIKEMGKIMGVANVSLKGKADGKRISEFVKKYFS